MPKLTDTHTTILAAAARRTDSAILPLPKSVRANKGAVTRTLNALLKHGLVEENPAGPDDLPWREEGDERFCLTIAADGLAAIGIDPEDRPAPSEQPATKTAPRASKPAAKAHPNTPHPDSKIGRMISLMRRKEGAGLSELTETLGWQPHTVRGAVSGKLKKQHGLIVISDRATDRGLVYRISDQS